MFLFKSKFFNILTLLQCILIGATDFLGATPKEPNENYFYYFAYGSNLLTKRIKINNPTAVKVDAAALKNYRLDFGNWSKSWMSSVANIVRDPNATTYGVLWKIDILNLEDLYRQEGTPTCYQSIYEPVTLLTNGTTMNALTFHLVNTHKQDHYEHRPSKTLIKCMVKGALEAKLPSEYIRFLQSIDYVDVLVPDKEKKLELADVELIGARGEGNENRTQELDSKNREAISVEDPHFPDNC